MTSVMVTVIDDTDYLRTEGKTKWYKGQCRFWMIDDSDEIVSLNGDQRRTTNLNIKRVIGTYDDFVLTHSYRTTQVFIDKTQKEKDLLACRYGYFDLLYKEQWK